MRGLEMKGTEESGCREGGKTRLLGYNPLDQGGLIPPPISGIPNLPKTPHHMEGAADRLALPEKKKTGFPWLSFSSVSSS